jgi:uncharacterized spore protein YtfJ
MLEAGILLVVVAAVAVGFKLRAGKKTTDKSQRGGGGGGGGRGGSGRRSNDLK